LARVRAERLDRRAPPHDEVDDRARAAQHVEAARARPSVAILLAAAPRRERQGDDADAAAVGELDELRDRAVRALWHAHAVEPAAEEQPHLDVARADRHV